MINFVICDDSEDFIKRMRKIIHDYMMHSDIEYCIQLFSGYGTGFYKYAREKKGFTIYFLDIQTENGSGLDAARMIREEYQDWTSIIIVVTAYNEYKYDALGNRLFLLDFVNKLDNCDLRLKEDLDRAMIYYDNKANCITIEFNRIVRKIEYKDIMYIEKEKDTKRCNIKTTYGDFKVSRTINAMMTKLDRRFLKISRSTIINLNFVEKYSLDENKIIFKNGHETYDVSRSTRREVINSVIHS